MELQYAIILGLAVAALALSILSIIFGIIFFRTQMQQAKSMMTDNSDFTKQMNILLNEIRISQNLTGQQVKDQYDKLLDAALSGDKSSVGAATTSAVQFEELKQRLGSLEKAATGLKEPEKVEAQIRDLRRSMEALDTTVRQLATHVTKEEREKPEAKPRFEKFSERARMALTVSQQEARRFGHDYIGSEHFLLGLIRDSENTACKILTKLGVDLSSVKSAIEFLLEKSGKLATADFGLTPRAKRVIELAIEEARRQKIHYISTEVILLGILLERGVAAGVLQNFGVTVSKVRAEARKYAKQGIKA